MIDCSALIPDFYRPCKPYVNPAVAEAEDAVVQWLWSTGLIATPAQERHLRSFQLGLCHGLATPTANLPQLVLGLKWFCWVALADDQFDSEDHSGPDERINTVLGAIRAVHRTGLSASEISNPVARGFAEYWPQLTAGSTDRCRERLAGNFLRSVESVVLQNYFHTRHLVPDTATYINLRRNTVLMLPHADILAIVTERTVPDELWDSYLFQELVLCFTDIFAWHNDVYGLKKDVADGETCNMVRVIAASERCSIRAATQRVLRRARHRQQMLLEIEAQLPTLVAALELPATAAAEASRLVQDMKAFLYANLVWASKTRRYDLRRSRDSVDDLVSSRG